MRQNNQKTVKTTRATCSSGVLTCSVLPVKVMSLCSSTCWGRSTVSGVKIWGQQGGVKPEEVDWQDNGLEGKLDLVVTLDFRLSSTCLYSDIILPTATWVRKRRHEYFGYASVYSPAVCGGRSGLGKRKATGKSTKPSRRNSPKCASAIWVKKPTSSRCLSSMTLPLNWRSRWM